MKLNQSTQFDFRDAMSEAKPRFMVVKALQGCQAASQDQESLRQKCWGWCHFEDYELTPFSLASSPIEGCI